MNMEQAVDCITYTVTVATMAAPFLGSAKVVERIGIIGKIWMFLAGNFKHAKNQK